MGFFILLFYSRESTYIWIRLSLDGARVSPAFQISSTGSYIFNSRTFIPILVFEPKQSTLACTCLVPTFPYNLSILTTISQDAGFNFLCLGIIWNSSTTCWSTSSVFFQFFLCIKMACPTLLYLLMVLPMHVKKLQSLFIWLTISGLSPSLPPSTLIAERDKFHPFNNIYDRQKQIHEDWLFTCSLTRTSICGLRMAFWIVLSNF